MADVDLARRAVASPGWRWPSTITATRVGVVRDPETGVRWVLTPGTLPHEWLPDLDDFATLGAVEHGLLAPAGVWVSRSMGGDEWQAWHDGESVGPWRDTLAAALVDGLERAS